MEINTLKKTLPPPALALEPPRPEDWTAFQREFTELPEDFKVFLETYGTGCIDDFIWIFNPAASNENLNLIKQAKKQIAMFKEVYSTGREKKSYPLFPETGGLIPFGITDNGDVLLWKTGGPPDTWSIVVAESRGPRYEEYAHQITKFLELILNSVIISDIFPDDFPSNNPKFVDRM